MDYQVSWSPEALDDVDAIAAYIARDSVFYAEAVVSRVRDVSRSLRKFPYRGRVVPEFAISELREVQVYSYRLLYQIQEVNVLIVAVIHGKRLLQTATSKE